MKNKGGGGETSKEECVVVQSQDDSSGHGEMQMDLGYVLEDESKAFVDDMDLS